jgi:hypothetical protein
MNSILVNSKTEKLFSKSSNYPHNYEFRGRNSVKGEGCNTPDFKILI